MDDEGLYYRQALDVIRGHLEGGDHPWIPGAAFTCPRLCEAFGIPVPPWVARMERKVPCRCGT